VRAAAVLALLALAELVAAQESAPASRSVPPAPWPDRHQEPDGSWAPAGFDRHCLQPGACAGLGKDELRVAATALMLLVHANAGFPGPEKSPAKALGFLLSKQTEDGGFGPAQPHAAMNDACGAVALCRVLAVAKTDGPVRHPSLERAAPLAVRRVVATQNADGSWGNDSDAARKLSTTVWSLLALKAGATAGIPADAACSDRGRAWVEKTAAAVESRRDPKADALALLRARTSRAVARVATGAPADQVVDEVGWLLEDLDRGGTLVSDAEVLLFFSLAAHLCGGSHWDKWASLARTHVIQPQIVEGCASSTWSTPSVWSDAGGRLVNTALMTWAMELYYAYPHAHWPG
jgi:Prenyltransferase and squalene oxidase repeat